MQCLFIKLLHKIYNIKIACPWCRASFLWMSQKQINLFLDTIGRNSPTVTLRSTLRGLALSFNIVTFE